MTEPVMYGVKMVESADHEIQLMNLLSRTMDDFCEPDYSGMMKVSPAVRERVAAWFAAKYGAAA